MQRDVRVPSHLSSSPLSVVSSFISSSLRNLSSSSPICLLLVLCISSVFSASSRRNVTTFAKAFDLDAGGWRRGRRIRIKRTDCRKLVKNSDEIREPPPPPLTYPSVVMRFSIAMFLSLSFSSLAAVRSVSLLHACPSFFTDFSHFITARCRPVSRCNVKDYRE